MASLRNVGWILAAAALAAAAPQESGRRTSFAVWDTGNPSGGPITPDALAANEGWTKLARGESPEFKGDAVLSNGRIAVVARRKGTGVEVYSLGLGRPVFRSHLVPLPSKGHAATTSDLKLAKRTRSSATLEVTAGNGVTVSFRLKRGDVFVETRPGANAGSLRVESPGRFALLPDFFADDILIDARSIPVDAAELPSENFVLQFVGKGDAIVMGVFENRAQEIRITLSGKGENRIITGSEIAFGKGHKVWTAILEGKGMWHTLDVAKDQAKKILPLDWKMPFVAQWRVDFTRDNGLTDSWEFLLKDKEGDGYIKPSWIAEGGRLTAYSTTSTGGEVDPDAYKPGGPAADRIDAERKKWITKLGRYLYPAWTDSERKGFLQPLDQRGVTHRGAVVIFPLNRLAATPIDAYTVVDLVRNTLGVGPCEYILDVEGQKQKHVGRATCHVRTCLKAIYGSSSQKARKKDILNYIIDGLDFVTHIRDRIDIYVEFGHDLRKYIAEQRKARPELKKFLDDMEYLARDIDERLKAQSASIQKQPVLREISKRLSARGDFTTRELIVELNKDFRKTFLDYEGKDWEKKMKKEYTDPLTRVGGSQDGTVGACRWVVKTIRQRAGLETAVDPRVAPIAAEIRARCQKVLRNSSAYEGARH